MQSVYERSVASAPAPPTQEPLAGLLQGDVAAWLNRCLRTELSAVETYDLAVPGIGRGELGTVLRQIRTSHQQRTIVLRDYLLTSGHEPAESSGVWGAFMKAVQAGADFLGDRTALTALEELEDHVAALYTKHGGPVDARTRDMVDTRILPEQRCTSDQAHTLLHFVRNE